MSFLRKSTLALVLVTVSVVTSGNTACQLGSDPGVDAGGLAPANYNLDADIPTEYLTEAQAEAFDNLREYPITDIRQIRMAHGESIYTASTNLDVIGYNPGAGWWDHTLNYPAYHGLGEEAFFHLSSWYPQADFWPTAPKLEYLMIRTLGRGWDLNTDSRWQTLEKDNITNEPAQDGLGYVFGNFEPNTQYTDQEGPCNFRNIRGVDAIGLMRYLMHWSGLEVRGDTPEKLVSTLNDTLETFDSSQDRGKRWDVRFSDVGPAINYQVESQSLSGDIVVWPNHIGMVFQLMNGSRFLFQSNGYHLNETDCLANYGQKRGPRVLRLSDVTNILGQPTAVYRMDSLYNGTWEMSVRCEGAAENVAEVQFDLNTHDDLSTVLNFSGVDGGDNYSLAVEMNYLHERGLLHGYIRANNLSRPETPTRVDIFGIYPGGLTDLDSGFFESFLQEPTDGSVCMGEVRFRKVTPAQAKAYKAKLSGKKNKGKLKLGKLKSRKALSKGDRGEAGLPFLK
ncbi:MAG TPA: hypothetical protein PLH57_06130 [Oligoflexia bacterium]|nr:hypothetical protein [Oligoflexia bacterium]